MTTQEIKDKLNEAIKSLYPKSYDSIVSDVKYLVDVYTKMFGEWPQVIGLEEEGIYRNRAAEEAKILCDSDEEKYDTYNDSDEDPDERFYTFKCIFDQLTMINFADYYEKTGHAYIHRWDETPLIFFSDEGVNKIIFFCSYGGTIYILQNNPELSELDKSLVIDRNKAEQDENRYFTYVTSTSHGFDETSLRIKKFDIDLNDNYNDDLPDDKIKAFLKGSQSGVILMHGVPGSGKTYYIRHLIYSIKRPFIVVDSTCFDHITDSSFVQLLLRNRNAVIILEDCEDMLADRITGNAKLATLLNLSDGIIGDNFNFKFLCTFNAKVNQLDKAILRKGRMHLKYEFKALTPDKTKKLGEKLGKDIPDGKSLTLSEIFYYNEDNGADVKEKKIGFQ